MRRKRFRGLKPIANTLLQHLKMVLCAYTNMLYKARMIRKKRLHVSEWCAVKCCLFDVFRLSGPLNLLGQLSVRMN